MKPTRITLLIIFFIYVFGELAGQPWCTVHTGRECLFQNDNIYKSLRIDSVNYVNDTVYYFNFTTLRYNDIECYKLGEPTWLGKYVMDAPNGDNLFFNKNNDTIRIKTSAALNTTWTCYRFSDGKYIQSSVTSLVNTSFLGLTDSVKTISFQLRDADGNNLNHPINQVYLKISRQYGFVHVVNFYLFPDLDEPGPPDYYFSDFQLVGITNPDAGFQNLKWSEVYDFEVGDELHTYTYSFYPPTAYATKMIRTIIGKEIYTSGDSLKYTYENCGCYYVLSETDTLNYPHHDTSYEVIHLANDHFDVLSNEPALLEDNMIEFAGNFLYENNIRAKGFPFDVSFVLADSCAFPIIDGPPMNVYLNGLGGPYWWYFEGVLQNYNELVYYKKGDLGWGTPFNCDSLLTDYKENQAVSDQVKVFPNPAEDYFTITLNSIDLSAQLILTDVCGNILITRKLDQISTTVSCFDLKPGLYFYQVLSDKNQRISGKIVIK